MNKENMVTILMTIITFAILIYVPYLILSKNDCCMCGAVENTCCPCPNNEWFDTVEKWAGYEASGAGSWYMMCIEYQEANNITFDCFD